MNEIARRWRILASGAAAGVAAVVGFAGVTASAEPVIPQPPLPGPATVTQTRGPQRRRDRAPAPPVYPV